MYLVCIVWHVQVFITIWLVPWHDMCYTWHDMTCISHDMVWHSLVRAWQANWSLFFFGIHDYFFVCLETQYTCNILIQNCFLFFQATLSSVKCRGYLQSNVRNSSSRRRLSVCLTYGAVFEHDSTHIQWVVWPQGSTKGASNSSKKIAVNLFQLVSSCSRVMFL